MGQYMKYPKLFKPFRSQDPVGDCYRKVKRFETNGHWGIHIYTQIYMHIYINAWKTYL